MPYEPNTWANGDVITATKLNNIEQGVSSVNSNYTPTTWANGDVITATKLNNIEQGIANAEGGGSGIFGSAQVTLNIGNGLTSVSISSGVEYPPDNPNSSDDWTYGGTFVIGDTQSSSPPTIDSTQTITILTYQNEGQITWPIYCMTEGLDTVASSSVVITGDAELITGGDYDHILVTGDCELTITWAE